jgi:putative transposase
VSWDYRVLFGERECERRFLTVSHRVLLITCPIRSKGQFKVSAPNRDPYRFGGGSDFTSTATQKRHVPKVEHVAFVIDAYARRIVGWRASQTAHTGFVLDALEQALHERVFDGDTRLIHHSDRGSQHVSIAYT